MPPGENRPAEHCIHLPLSTAKWFPGSQCGATHSLLKLNACTSPEVHAITLMLPAENNRCCANKQSCYDFSHFRAWSLYLFLFASRLGVNIVFQ
eukprot:2650417-Amphidinium_carterae.2